MSKSRTWCGRLSNPTHEDHNKLVEFSGVCEYLVIGAEKGKEGTPHFQIYMEFANARCMSGIKKEMKLPGIHLEMKFRQSTNVQAADYCKKPLGIQPDGSEAFGFQEFGVLVPDQQGHRSDLDVLAEMVIQHKTDREIMEAFPSKYLIYSRMIKQMRLDTYPEREGMPIAYWFWGPPDCGKSHLAKAIGKTLGGYYPKDSTPWWDNYRCEKLILVDDFDGIWPFRDILNFLDYGRYHKQVKGGYVDISSPFVIFTSDRPPHMFYDDENGNKTKEQFLRRIKRVYHLGNHSDPKTFPDETEEAEKLLTELVESNYTV